MVDNLEFYRGGDVIEVLGAVLTPSALQRADRALRDWRIYADEDPALNTPEGVLRAALPGDESELAFAAILDHVTRPTVEVA